jgi:hypothetical protein
LSERSLLTISKNIPRFDYDAGTRKLMNSSIVVGFLRMKQCLHRIYDLVFPVSIASLPGSNKVYVTTHPCP